VGDLGRYLLAQAPGWILVALVVFLGVAALDLPRWVAGLALALFVAKDLALYPTMRVIFRPADDRGLLGATGRAVEPLAPTGYVLVQGERWRATLRGGGALEAGAAVRVVGAQGLTLLVEPAEGGVGPA
jgi:membrane protein implicated in regulation of membrane protease activity